MDPKSAARDMGLWLETRDCGHMLETSDCGSRHGTVDTWTCLAFALIERLTGLGYRPILRAAPKSAASLLVRLVLDNRINKWLGDQVVPSAQSESSDCRKSFHRLTRASAHRSISAFTTPVSQLGRRVDPLLAATVPVGTLNKKFSGILRLELAPPADSDASNRPRSSGLSDSGPRQSRPVNSHQRRLG